jgi:GT2 family glycosyltransferase
VSTVASILIPTRRRPGYLAVALGSIVPQAVDHGAEVIVVEDGAADPESERLTRAGGAVYLPLGRERGLNAARNAAIEHANADLLCFVDDDVEVWPGWLSALLDAAMRLSDHELFGGPIRARVEGWRLRVCGREPPPITTLDLGPGDRDAEVVWGANMALRRSALRRVGPFDPQIRGPGDEEEWERRLVAAGGRIRYVAGAGVDHRRAGPDARLLAMARAAYVRGRSGRRYDWRKGTAPGLGSELRLLAACAWHIPRHRCANGLLVLAQSAGRVHERLLERGS